MFSSNYEAGGRHRRQRRSPIDGPCFVVQHRLAHSDHYDFRLEINGVLVSWKISDGPSTTVADQRMARRTQDHPLEYATFEGVIPEGRHGPDGVVVWDHGTYANGTHHDMAKGLACGHVSFHLRGDKLRGRYAMTRIREGDEETWLWVKRRSGTAHHFS